MLAVKAVYDNGSVKWIRRMTISGRHSLIVLFEDVSGPEAPDAAVKYASSSMDDMALPPLPELEGAVPEGWKDAIYGT